jgi:hypothetical protein
MTILMNKSNKALNYIYSLNKKLLNDFLLLIIQEIVPSTKYKSKINIISELNKYMTRRNILPKEEQIILCFFLALFTQNLEVNNFISEFSEDEIKLKGNFEKINLITNIDEIKTMSEYKNHIQITDKSFQDMLTDKRPILIETSKLNKRKFDTNKLFIFVLKNYKYEFIMTKLVKTSITFLFLLFQYYINDRFLDTAKELKEYVKLILVDILEKENEENLKEIKNVP